ncbi:Uncharacterised protein [Aeromonas salmonicida]|nr:Uncharacterised protein [Aeromonas salmonicida]
MTFDLIKTVAGSVATSLLFWVHKRQKLAKSFKFGVCDTKSLHL